MYFWVLSFRIASEWRCRLRMTLARENDSDAWKPFASRLLAAPAPALRPAEKSLNLPQVFKALPAAGR
jgi:hypothetical protein